MKALACELPANTGVPLSRWSLAELAAEAVSRGVVDGVSAATVWRWLIATKAAVVLDLYARLFEGQALGPDEYVVTADEKTSIQARCRCHPTLPPGKARLMRVEHEYERGGALAYLASTTCTGPRCRGAARRRRASPPSAGWSSRS